jgi:phosphate uptake regulator
MEVRKLVKSGYASLVIAVPKAWLTKNKLKAGNLIYIKEEKNKLIIGAESKPSQAISNEITIDIDGKDPSLIPYDVISAYLNNVKYIVIKGKQLSKVVGIVKKSLSDLIALELIDESRERIVARNFLNLDDIDLKVLIRRMDNIIRSMIIDTKEGINHPDMVPMIVSRDKEINRLSFLVYKILKTAFLDKSLLDKLQIEELDILRYWQVNIHLEKIGDCIKHMVNIVGKMKPTQKEKFVELFVKIEDLYKVCMKAFYEFSITESNLVIQKKRKLLLEIEQYVESCNSAICSEVAINAYNMTGNVNSIARLIRNLDTKYESYPTSENLAELQNGKM